GPSRGIADDAVRRDEGGFDDLSHCCLHGRFEPWRPAALGKGIASGWPGTKSAAAGNRWLLPGLVVDLGTRSVFLDRLDPVQRGRLALVHFTGRDDLTIGGY